jgi:hypothetical protein
MARQFFFFFFVLSRIKRKRSHFVVDNVQSGMTKKNRRRSIQFPLFFLSSDWTHQW